MNFSNIRFLDINVAEPGNGLTPATPLKDIPDYTGFVDDCLYIFRKYPSVARTSTMISPTGMTTYTKDEWEISDSDRQSNLYGAYRAFDGEFNSEYSYLSQQDTTFPHWIRVKNLNKKICVKSYAIRTRYNASNASNYNPTSWILEGSDDALTWVTIDDRTGDRSITWPTSDYGKKIFNIPTNNSSYYYHRITFRSGVNARIVAIGEIEFYDNIYSDENYYTLPVFGEIKTGITNFGFIGCPEEGSIFWDYLPEETRSALVAAGWTGSGYDYATILCNTVNAMNFSVSSSCNMFLDGIDFLRNNDTTVFNVSHTSTTNRNMFYFSGGNNFVHIRNCRFSEMGVNIDDERYMEPKPGMKSCAYVYCSGFVDSLIFEDNIVNYIPQTQGNDSIAYDGFSFTGMVCSATINNNKFYMTKSDATSWISGTTGTNNMRSRTCFYINGNVAGNDVWQQSRFICFNNNKLTLRLNDYKNINSWVSFPYFEKIEFVGNSVVGGRDMGNYDYSEMNMPLYFSSLIDIGENRYCTDYLIKDFYANVSFMWGNYRASFMSLQFMDEYNDYFSRWGYNRSSKRNIIDNIVINLGEGPAIGEMSSSNKNLIEAWNHNNTYLDAALYIEGFKTYDHDTYYRYCNHSNMATNISVSNPWGYAAFIRLLYAEFNDVRGGICAGDSCYLKIKNMSIKNASPRSFSLWATSSNYIEVDNLLIEDASIENYFWAHSSNNRNFTIIINKTNHPIVINNSAISTDSSNYNESMIIQKDIGEEHAFMIKSLNKFVESCNIQYNGINTLKMFGLYDHYRSLRLSDTGDTGLTSRRITPGKYKIRVNMAFNGDDLVENTVTNPSTDRKNVLNRDNLIIGIKTKNGNYAYPDNVGLGCNGEWSSNLVTPFYQEYYINIYEEQDIFTTIERFNVYSSGFSINSLTSAIYLSPLIEVTKIGDVEISNSNSESNGE